MRKNLFLAIPLILGISYSNAQKVEITASYGTPSLYGLIYTLSSAITNISPGSDDSFAASLGTFNFTVNLYSPSEKWRYGLDLVIESYKKENNISNGSFISVMAKADYMWLNPDNKLQLYSGFATGATFASYKYIGIGENETLLSVNLLPLGIKYGRNLSVFVDTNVGTKSFAQAGIGYKF